MTAAPKPLLTFFSILIVLSLLIPCAILTTTVKADGGNWLEPWEYRKSHTIAQTSGAGSDYTVMIRINYGSGTDGTTTYQGMSFGNVYLNSHSQTDFDDIRFTSSDGTTLLHYYIEEKVDSDHANTWVKIPDDLSSSSVDIYIYYGNADAASASDGKSTFVLFDDFSNGFNTTLWDARTTATVSSGLLTLANHNEIVYSDIQYDLSVYAMRGRAQNSVISNSWLPVMFGYSDTNQGHLASTHQASFTVGYYAGAPRVVVNHLWQSNGGSSTVIFQNAIDDHFYTIELIRQSPTDGYDTYAKASDSSGNYAYGTESQFAFTNNMAYIEFQGMYNGLGTVYVDYVFLRKHITTEPVQSTWGGEEELEEDIPTWKPTFESSPPLNGTVGVEYSYTPILNESVTLELESSPVWAGLVEESIIGFPNAAGSYDFSLKATSTNGTLAEWQNWTAVITTPVPIFENSPTENGTKRVWYSWTPSVDLECNFILSANAGWIRINPSTGEVYGLPTTSGLVTVHLTATSVDYGTNTTISFNITIADWITPPDDDGDDTGGTTDPGTQTPLESVPQIYILVAIGALFLFVLVLAASRRR